MRMDAREARRRMRADAPGPEAARGAEPAKKEVPRDGFFRGFSCMLMGKTGTIKRQNFPYKEDVWTI